jgi:hypothetical protein
MRRRDGPAHSGDVGAVIDVEVELTRTNHLREAGEDADMDVHVVSVASLREAGGGGFE